jgi:hypothetical protein
MKADPAYAGQAIDVIAVFDIVNGFLNRCRGAWIARFAFGQIGAIDASQTFIQM